MTQRCVLMVLSALLCASPLLAGVDSSAPFTVAKFEAPSPVKPARRDALLDVKESYQYYDVDGTTPAELRAMMRQNGTRWNDGKVYAALATWDITYNYGVSSDNGVYAVDDINTKVAVIYHLPRLASDTTASPALVEKWNTYMANVKEHEHGHGELAVKAAGEINQILASLGTFTSKKALDQEANRLITAKLKQLKQIQVGYDDDTRHGETQGAILE